MGHQKKILLMIKRKLILLMLPAFCLLACAGRAGTPAFAQSRSLSEVFKKVNPSVVKIITLTQADRIDASGVSGAVSSGVIISDQGQIMTAAHAVNTADKIMVILSSSQVIEADVVSLSTDSDIALIALKTVPETLPVAQLGNSDQVSIGDEVFVIGAPYGIDHTLSVGHISGRRKSRTICREITPFEFLQTDAAINQGNSGGPMFNEAGQVVGIVSRILSSTGGSMGLGFAVSINTARQLLLENQSFWIGFDAFLLYGDLAKSFNLPQEAGLLVQTVAQNSPGADLGLKPGTIPVQIGDDSFLIGGDIVLTVQGFPVTYSVDDVCAIQDTIGGFTKDSRIDLTVLREGKIIHLTTDAGEK